jgi:hypothetical protein
VGWTRHVASQRRERGCSGSYGEGRISLAPVPRSLRRSQNRLLRSWPRGALRGAPRHSERAQRVEGSAPARDAPIATDFTRRRGGARRRGERLSGSRSSRRRTVHLHHDPKSKIFGVGIQPFTAPEPSSVLRASAGRGESGRSRRHRSAPPREPPAQKCLCAKAEQLDGRARRTEGTRYCVRRPGPRWSPCPLNSTVASAARVQIPRRRATRSARDDAEVPIPRLRSG